VVGSVCCLYGNWHVTQYYHRPHRLMCSLDEYSQSVANSNRNDVCELHTPSKK